MRLDTLPILKITVCFGLLFGAPSIAIAQDITGTAKAVDGDTLDFTGIRVDLAGIDAPELEQSCTKDGDNWACGEQAEDFLAALIEGQELRCLSQTTNNDGVVLAICQSASQDIALTMIEAGLATAHPSAPEAYIHAEALRQTHRIGIWSGDFEQPELWRAAHPEKMARIEKTAPRQAQSSHRQAEHVYRNRFGCAIKGNKSRRGEWIYHLPGAPHYEQTRPEALFCTETQARQAGYRRSKA